MAGFIDSREIFDTIFKFEVMKYPILFLFLFFSIQVLSQTERNNEWRLSYLAGFSYGQPSASGVLTEADFPDLISGADLKMIFPSKKRNMNWLLGSMFVSDHDSYSSFASSTARSASYGGGIYFGPELFTRFSVFQFSTYISGGLFSFHNDMLEVVDNSEKFNLNSNFTAQGVKSGINLQQDLKYVTLNLGYQAFATASQNSTMLRIGPELGLGLKQ